MIKALSLATVVVLAGLAATPASARTNLRIAIGPPDPVVEVVPAPRRGYVWAPGYWAWHRGHHQWVKGHWIREHRGRHWVADRWDHDHDRWVFVPGRWAR